MPPIIEAILTLTGMIIGVGMFGIPFSFRIAGFWLGTLELAVLSLVVLSLHLFYAEIVLRTEHIHRLPGYVGLILGGKQALLSKGSALFGISGSLLAYLILGSAFLNNIFRTFWSSSSEFTWVIFLVVLVAAVTYLPVRKESFINGLLTILLVLFILFLISFLLPKAHLVNLSGFNVAEFFIPYGVLLFALSGSIIIPEVVLLTGREPKKVRRAVIIGSLLPAILYFLFATAVIGVLGRAVSPETIQGLRIIAGQKLFLLGSVIGFLAVITSFVATSKNFQELLRIDFHTSRRTSWVVVALLPFVLYMAGFQNFILVISVVGILGVGIDSLLIVWSHYRLFKKERRRHLIHVLWKYGICFLVLSGVFYELYGAIF